MSNAGEPIPRATYTIYEGEGSDGTGVEFYFGDSVPKGVFPSLSETSKYVIMTYGWMRCRHNSDINDASKNEMKERLL